MTNINKILNIHLNGSHGSLSILSLLFLYYLSFEAKNKFANDIIIQIINIVLLYSLLLLFTGEGFFRNLVYVFIIILITSGLNTLDRNKLLLVLFILFCVYLADLSMVKKIDNKYQDPTLITNEEYIKKYKRENKLWRYYVLLFVLLVITSSFVF